MKKPSLREYLNLSEYLKDLYKFRKSTLVGFSYEGWAAELNLKSRAHLRSIVIGEGALNDNLIPNFIIGLKLDESSAEYFTLLAKYSAATSAATKQAFGKPLLQLWKNNVSRIEVSDIETFLSDALIPVVFTYLSFEDAAWKVEDMAKELGCDTHRVQSALKCLVWQKLVDGSLSELGDPVYKTVKPFFNVPHTPNNSFLKSFHLEGLKLAEASHNFPTHTRKFYSSFFALSDEEFKTVQDIIEDCNSKISALFDSPTLGDRKIYRFNAQVFPVSGQITELLEPGEKLDEPSSKLAQ